jgi:hypothetical protein
VYTALLRQAIIFQVQSKEAVASHLGRLRTEQFGRSTNNKHDVDIIAAYTQYSRHLERIEEEVGVPRSNLEVTS